jgi:hypothetical protein
MKTRLDKKTEGRKDSRLGPKKTYVALAPASAGLEAMPEYPHNPHRVPATRKPSRKAWVRVTSKSEKECAKAPLWFGVSWSNAEVRLVRFWRLGVDSHSEELNRLGGI